jgi:hypothetical protein
MVFIHGVSKLIKSSSRFFVGKDHPVLGNPPFFPMLFPEMLRCFAEKSSEEVGRQVERQHR